MSGAESIRHIPLEAQCLLGGIASIVQRWILAAKRNCGKGLARNQLFQPVKHFLLRIEVHLLLPVLITSQHFCLSKENVDSASMSTLEIILGGTVWMMTLFFSKKCQKNTKWMNKLLFYKLESAVPSKEDVDRVQEIPATDENSSHEIKGMLNS
ncbi:hypothetical protein CEXT_705121 [Caerostris extrusa]|uniref:Uncharacterized protein n=1 Tax=Caerostris extrusa TaxID=172846 RepID=A0AAV4NSM9_CAEEX|nr:hypothetical protein CEXT_705121 [Caerostris extrusa]